jgi:chemotaxis-related protein WspB
MQFLLFSLGNDRYGLDTRRVMRVLPQLDLKELPQAPAWVSGLMNYRGQSVPVIDLSMLACGTPGQPNLDTRIVLADYRDAAGKTHALGLLAEQASDVRHFSPEDFQPPGVDNPDAPYLGQVAASDGSMVQLVDVDALLPAKVQALLFPAETEMP